MRFPYEVYLDGPLPPLQPRDPYARTVRNAAEHGEDMQREGYVHGLIASLPRPLSLWERQVAQDDPGLAPRVYAPASARVIKDPHPEDAEILEAGRHHTITAESALHPGDRSDPGELR